MYNFNLVLVLGNVVLGIVVGDVDLGGGRWGLR